jgi:signal transduction histidine kinase
MKKEKHSRVSLIVLAIILAIAAIAAESLYFSDFEYNLMTRRFNRILREKEKIMKECLDRLQYELAREQLNESISKENIFSIAKRNGITILEYFDKTLVHWSDNNFDVPAVPDDSLFLKPLIFMQNGWFLPEGRQTGNQEFIGLLRIRTDYSYENDIVRSGFNKDFRIPDEVKLSRNQSDSGFNVYNSQGNFLFSLAFPETKANTLFIIIPLILWISVLGFIILLSLNLAVCIDKSGKALTALAILTGIFIIIYLFILFLKGPAVFMRTQLFSPFIFYLNKIVPSLGHLLLLGIFTALISYRFYNSTLLTEDGYKIKLSKQIFLIFILVASAVILCLFHNVFTQLVLNSNINFETYKVLKLSFLSVIGFVSMILMVLVPVFMLLKVVRSVHDISLKQTLLLVFPSFIIIIVFFHRDLITLTVIALFWLLLILIAFIAHRRHIGLFNSTIFFSILFGLYSLYVITVNSESKINENIKVQALSFSTENDPLAEHLILDMWPVLKNDTTLYRMMTEEDFNMSQNNVDRITSYLTETYFTGYWGSFNINIVLCRKDQQLRVGTSDEDFEDCFDFFNGRTAKYGHQLTGTNFYFIDNQGGRSYYIGILNFTRDFENINGLFIELYSDVNVFQPGYTELLLDKKFNIFSDLREYSYAKYINGLIVLNSGDFPYKKTDDEYIDENSEYRIFNAENKKHVVYKNGNTTVVISRPLISPGNILISFAYLLAFILFIGSIIALIIRRPSIRVALNLNFRQKLQVSYMAILLISFILIGIVVASLTVKEYRSKHYENIKEKLNSINVELENKLTDERQLLSGRQNYTNETLNQLLIDLSNIFNTDINIYDLKGFLVATSRPEIFYRNLTSHRMDITAFINVSDFTRTEYFQTENIGNMKYISVYMPFYSSDYKVLAFLNLPYFRMQSVLAREISNLIVAIMNFTLLLILITMGLAVFISGRLTSPLSMLSEGLASVKLGRKSEHLSYSGSDEIGDMVKQYNRMVDELEISTHKLAASEREYAWREMAKQIAHEIKNPLTPMKLNVQQLLKSWKDDSSDFKDKLDLFAKNQIEYIDNLSLIATAFSSFAKMPGANPADIDLIEQIKTTLELFRNTGNVTFEVKWPNEKKVFIHADKEQINGIFSNLIKNSIQAIPQDRDGIIKVELKVTGDKVLVSVSDNGSGIPENLKNRMFTPNFTTKSSGTGLGLSIAKRYAEGANGRIWFESQAGRGATFFIEFPLKYTVEKPGETKIE